MTKDFGPFFVKFSSEKNVKKNLCGPQAFLTIAVEPVGAFFREH